MDGSMHSRRRTYCPNPFIERLNRARREWSICLTRSSSSSLSSFVQPCSIWPSGKMAYCALLSVDVVVAERPNGCGSSSPPSTGFDKRFNEALSLSIARVSPGRSDILYVGRRLRNLPIEGMKSEFWTWVRVESVATSGSVKSQLLALRLGRSYMPTTSSKSTVSASYSFSEESSSVRYFSLFLSLFSPRPISDRIDAPARFRASAKRLTDAFSFDGAP